MPITDRLIWLDVETFGLDPELDPVLEVGFRIVNADTFDVVDDRSVLIWDTPFYDNRMERLEREVARGSEGAKIVLNMHRSNKLFDDCMNAGMTPQAAEEDLLNWLHGHGIRGREEPLCGSSVGGFDRPILRAQMPRLDEQFHYRVIDVSTLKELCSRFAPDMYARMPEFVELKKRHRVLDDLDDSIAEYRFYFDNFLYVTSHPFSTAHRFGVAR